MLAVTRRIGESVAIGEHIVIKVLDVQGQRVQLGIQAPEDLKIQRSESPDPPAAAPERK